MNDEVIDIPKPKGWPGDPKGHSDAAKKGHSRGGNPNKKSRKKYWHVVLIPKQRFKPKPYSTLDVGSEGGMQLVRGRLKSNNQWATQKILLSKTDWEKRGSRLVPKTARGRNEANSLQRQGIWPLTTTKYQIHG